MTAPFSRRQLLASASVALAGTALSATVASRNLTAAEPAGLAANVTGRPASEPFGYSFNTSTIRGQKVGIVEEVEIAAKAGYQAIEPWIRELDEYVKEGGSLKDLGKRISDRGLSVESAIGFAEWIVDDDAKRAKGLEEAKRNMDMLVEIGGKRLAAPPVGATKQSDLNLLKAADRYRDLCKVGEQTGIVPQVEVWGFSQSLSRVGESMLVVLESGHPQACLLADVYHIHKGGSDFNSLRLLSGRGMHVFHVNDYPAEPARAALTDAHRVYPGDGVAPLTSLFRDLRDNGFHGFLSLELFNPDYWKQDPFQVAKTGLEKTRAAVQKAFG